MVWGCIVVGESGVHHLIDGILNKERYLEKLEEQLKTSDRQIKLRCRLVFQ